MSYNVRQEPGDPHRALWHPWLRVERLTRLAVAARLWECGPDADRALAA